MFATQTGSVDVKSIAVDAKGSVWLSGSFTDEVDFGQAQVLRSTTDEAAAFVLRIDPMCSAGIRMTRPPLH